MRHFVQIIIISIFFNPDYNISYAKDRIKFSSIAFLDSEQKSTAKLIYKDGFLSINGLIGSANVIIYSIIGNEIAFFSNIDLKNFKESILLQKETMYIARIDFTNTVFTYKFFTR